MRKFPQVLLNVKVAARFDPTRGAGRARGRARASRRAWAGEGRVVLRASGTEPRDPGDGRGAR